jgi:GMP synthase (glutamine-hydrolysing)
MTDNIHVQKILILDFGSQYSQLIARRVREAGVYCEIFPCQVDAQYIQEFKPSGIILSGGPETVIELHTPRAPEIIFQLGCPILGICYGMQTMATQLNGKVDSHKHGEFGYAQVQVLGSSKLLDDIADHLSSNGSLLDVWMSHGDQVTQLPPGFVNIAKTANTEIAAMADENKKWYGIQFHPEVTHTHQGQRILERFVLDICGCSVSWTTGNIIRDNIEKIQQQVGKGQIILGLSGGVDSLVVAALLHKAVGNQLTCVYVNTGLMRHDEQDIFSHTYVKRENIHVVQIDAEQRFLSALSGITDPEQKRKIIGKLFIDVFVEQAKLFKDAQWLAQGTIYSDVIESAHTQTGGKAHVIKSHHNVGGLPEKLPLKLIEPLRELFKDEVRKIGMELGLPYDEVYRHPFPGPGLGIRILGEVNKEFADLLRKADAIYIDELRKHDLYHKVSQAFAVFLPIKSVGVMGDARKYEYVIALRAVESTDFMTAHWAELPYAFLSHVANRIVNEVPKVSRVVYDITGKPPATIEWE